MNGLPGDIVLFPCCGKDGWESRIVGVGELLFRSGKSPEQYSHAAVLAETPGMIWEASWPRIGCHTLDLTRDFEIRRPPDYTDAQRAAVLAWFKTNNGLRYDLGCLLTFGLVQANDIHNFLYKVSGGKINFPQMDVCSQAVGLALQSAGRTVDYEGAHIPSPDAIADGCPDMIDSHKGGEPL